MKNIVAGGFIDLGAEVDHVGLAEQGVFQVGVVDVDAAHLEEPYGSPCMAQHREEGPGPLAFAFR
jgi:hypothetical protein